MQKNITSTSRLIPTYTHTTSAFGIPSLKLKLFDKEIELKDPKMKIEVYNLIIVLIELLGPEFYTRLKEKGTEFDLEIDQIMQSIIRDEKIQNIIKKDDI